MNHTWKLSNYLAKWYMKKYGKIIFIVTLVLGALQLLVFSTPQPGAFQFGFNSIPFRTYDMVVDYSFAEMIFRLGLIGILICIFLQANSFYINGKGMYTIFTLPMKRREVFQAFFLSAFSVVLLYFAVWMILMVGCYFPVTSMYVKAAAETKIPVSADMIINGMDTHVRNGLFLAFQRSNFLSGTFPVSWIQVVTLTGGMLLAVVSAVAAGLYNQVRFFRVVLLITAWFGIYAAFARSAKTAARQVVGMSFTELPTSIVLGSVAGCLAILVCILAIRGMKRRKDI